LKGWKRRPKAIAIEKVYWLPPPLHLGLLSLVTEERKGSLKQSGKKGRISESSLAQLASVETTIH